ncbi:MAG: hypothetical protein ACOX50_01855 [Patescibacteria group bacterium]|jgi:hypothetical protein
MKKSLPSQAGQVVLVILLVVSVILVVGLSAVSLSVTDIKLSQQSQESARALYIAQAGLEKAIRANADVSGEDSSLSVEYSVVKEDLGNSDVFVFPDAFEAGDGISFWFLPHNPDGSLDTTYNPPNRFSIAWGESDTNTALEATVIYQFAGSFYTQRYVYGPDNFNGEPTGFTPSAGPLAFGGKNFLSSSGEISFPAGAVPYLMQLRLLFNSSPQFIGVRSGDSADFPQQGSCFTATATVPESGITRKLEQCQLWPTVPTIFNYLLFSEGSIGGGI